MVDTKTSQYVNSVADAMFEALVLPMTFMIYEHGQLFSTVHLPHEQGHILANGVAKAHLFGWWREQCKNPDVDALAVGCGAWMFEQNAKAEELLHADPEGFRKLVDHGFNHMLALGLGTRHEAFMVTAQTRDLVVIAQRRFERRDGQIVFTAPAIRDEFPQANFAGRQKMWGDLSPENLR